MQAEGVNPGGLQDILKQAQERGSQKREGEGQTLKSTWEKVKAAGAKVKDAVDTSYTIARGMTDPDVQASLLNYVGDRKTESWNKTKEKFAEIRDKAGEKKDGIVSATLDRLGKIGRGAEQRLIKPTVGKAIDIAKGARSTALKGTLFGYFALENSKLGLEAAGQKAQEWGGRLQNFTQEQGRMAQEGVAQGRADIASGWYSFQAGRSERGAQKKEDQAARAREKANQRNEHAASRRQKASELRMAKMRIAPRA